MKIESPKKSTLKETLDHLFEAMDKAPTAADHPIFKNAADKEYYETQLMFAYRKLEAGRHHLENVEGMLEKSKAQAMTAMKKHKKPGKNVIASTASMIVNGGSAARYIHELSAFLAAIRSGLDFLTVAAARTIKGVTAHSVHDLEKMAAKGHTGPVLDAVRAHHAWLAELREYRDEVVHRLVVQAPAEGWLISTKGKTSKTVLPIVVPRKTPERASDTRRSRMMEDLDTPFGLERWESHGAVSLPDGTKEVWNHEVVFSPADSHVPIVELMEYHLFEYQKFSAAIFDAIVSSKFGKAK